MTGYYLKCDACGAELGVESVPSMKHEKHPRDYVKLQRYAREIGWTGPLHFEWNLPESQRGQDRCPACSASEPSPKEVEK